MDLESINEHGSLVKVTIGGRTYDARKEPRCKVCMHPARLAIEEKILQGHGTREIAALYSGTDYTHPNGKVVTFPLVEGMSIYNHFRRGHLPVEVAALREIADRRAKEISKNYEEQTARIVDGYTFATQVLHKAQERLISEEITPDVRDGLAAAKLLREMDEDAEGTPDNEVWGQAMTVYFETARRLMPPQMWIQFTEALGANPVLNSLQRRLEASPEVVDAEIVDERERS